MQRKYSEVVQYMPSFPATESRRNSRQPIPGSKLGPPDGLLATQSPTYHTSIQYQALIKHSNQYGESQMRQNGSFQGQDRRCMPLNVDRASLVNTVQSPMLAQSRPSLNGIRNGEIAGMNMPPRRLQNPFATMDEQHKFSSPQSATRPQQGQFQPKYTLNPQPVADTSPLKLQQFQAGNKMQAHQHHSTSTQSILTQSKSPTNSRAGGRVYQSMIISDGEQADKAHGSGSGFGKSAKPESEVYASQVVQAGISGYSGLLESKARHVGSDRKPRKSSEVWTSNQFKFPRNQLIYPAAKLDYLPFQFKSPPKEEIKKQKSLVPELKRQSQQKDVQENQSISQNSFTFRKRTESLSYKQPVEQPAEQAENKQFTIEDFETIEKLGKGAYGDVFLVREKKTRFLCVLKSLSKKKIKELGLEEHVFREIKIQTYLVHKHITSMYGVFDDKNKIYLIMQCMPDGSMASNGKKKISQSQTAFLIQQVCDGLHFMHREDILHRDIKPENLLLNNSYLKIGDFGCAVFGNTLRRTVVGCYAYISPEQFSNTPYDQKIDSWSVGVLAYEMLTGRPPYEEKLRKYAIDSHKTQGSVSLAETVDFPEVEFPKDVKVSAEAVDFIKRLLEKDPVTRADMKEALKHKFLLKAKQFQKQLQSKM